MSEARAPDGGLRPRGERGRIHRPARIYGRSRLGAPLQVWEAEQPGAGLLVTAGIHGDEGEGVVLLSAALRGVPDGRLAAHVVLAQNPDGLLLGTRGNAHGVDLNRNFAAENWSPDPVRYRWTVDAPRDVVLSPGETPASEPETLAFVQLVERLRPQVVLSVHAPLACVDDPADSALGRWLASRTGLEHVRDVGYPTPGSLGSAAASLGVEVVTLELPDESRESILRNMAPVLHDVLMGVAPV